MGASVRVGIVASFLLLGGCAKRGPTSLLDEAARKAQGGKADARTLALAGFHALLADDNPVQAESRFDSAVTQNPGEPYALLGQMITGERQAAQDKTLTAAIELVTRTPTHPLAAIAARHLLDTSGTSAPQDDRIRTAAELSLARGAAGDAAQLLRSALAAIAYQRGDTATHARILAAMGVVDRVTLTGPHSVWHRLAFDETTPTEESGNVEANAPGPLGELRPRTLLFPDGRLGLSGEPPPGDVYLLSTDVEVARGGDYIVRTLSSASHKVLLDGTRLFERRTFERPESTVSQRGVTLRPGRHRVLIKLLKESRPPSISLSISRADGRPANLQLSPSTGSASTWSGVATREAPATFSRAQDVAAALEAEAGEALASYVAAWDGMNRDRDGAKRLVARLFNGGVQGPAATFLRAKVALGDRTVPSKVAQGRATRDVEATLEKDKEHVEALMLRASLAVDDGRLSEAAEWIKQARAARHPVGVPVLLLQARVELALGIDAQAEQSTLAALKAQPGLCEALSLRYDLARRRDAVTLSDELVHALEPCPGALTRGAEHLKARGNLAGATALWEKARARDPSQVDSTLRLSELYASGDRHAEAERLLEDARALWPRDVALLKRLGDLYESTGRRDDALQAREAALTIDGGDLTLRRSVWRARTGRELLSEHAVTREAALANYRAQPGSEEAASTYVLDAAATQAFADGSTVDRIHIIQKALDSSGVSEIAEVNIPSGAQVLSLRTLKADGTTLEPETIEGKEAVSLPGVQVGDAVEYEYLQAHPARGPAQPGFTAASFYFQIARAPNHWSTYTVVAPEGSGLAVDAHNTAAAAPVKQGGYEIFKHDARRVPPFVPEPNAPPSPNEYLPFVSIGAKAQGNEGLLREYADDTLDGGQRTFEVEQFARAAAGNKKGKEAVRALYAAVMERLSGRDAGLGLPAAASLAQDRGSRLWALKAGLEVLGVPTRIAAVRTFAVDPAPYRFPNEALFTYVCLRAQVGGEEVWLDPLVRFAPFGELPEPARGREAYLLPEPGHPLKKVKTPSGSAIPLKQVALALTLSETGTLSGSGEEAYSGFEAAQLGEALDALSPEQRTQALQSALTQYFGGATLSQLNVDWPRKTDAGLRVRYVFTAERFARAEPNQKMVIPPLTFPALLGRRFVQMGARTTSLFIDQTEASRTQVSLSLPPGYALASPIPEIKTGGPFGTFLRRERVEKGRVTVEEEYEVRMARIPPEGYEAFSEFAGQVDLVQARDLLVEKK